MGWGRTGGRGEKKGEGVVLQGTVKRYLTAIWVRSAVCAASNDDSSAGFSSFPTREECGAQSRLQSTAAISNLKPVTSFPIVVNKFATTMEAALRRTGSEGQRTGISGVVSGGTNSDGCRNYCNCASESLARGEAEEATKGASRLQRLTSTVDKRDTKTWSHKEAKRQRKESKI